MARFIALGEVPGLQETSFRAALDEFKKWRIDRQSWVVKAYLASEDGRLVVECETPDRARFEAWLARTGWPLRDIYQVNLIHEAGTVWPV